MTSSSSESFDNSKFRIGPTIPPIYDPAGTSNLNNRSNQLVSGADGVASRMEDQLQMMARWELILTLKGGTLAMREAKMKYLPKEPGETQEQYENRVLRSYLYGVYSHTVKVLSSLPFSDPISIKNVPDQLMYLRDSTTQHGEMGLAEFARELLEDTIDFGKAHYLVDYPVIPEGISLREEQLLNPRPFFVKVHPQNIIGWRLSESGELIELRLYEFDMVQGENWEEEERHRVRVIRPGLHIIHEKTEDGWVEVDRIPVKVVEDKIPLITIYGNKDRKGPMIASPLLEELAHLNLQHWQKLSDLNNIEHIVNVPFMLATGFEAEELKDVIVSAQNLIKTTNPDADVKFVEHTGNSIPYSHKSIENLEKRMIVMGADLLTQQATSRQTAFAKAVDSGKSMSILEAVVNNVSDGLEKGFRIAAEIEGVEAPDDMSITIGEAMDLSMEDGDKEWLTTLAEKGFMKVPDLTYELKRRGKLSHRTELKTPKREDNIAPPQGNLDEEQSSNTDQNVNEGE